MCQCDHHLIPQIVSRYLFENIKNVVLQLVGCLMYWSYRFLTIQLFPSILMTTMCLERVGVVTVFLSVAIVTITFFNTFLFYLKVECALPPHYSSKVSTQFYNILHFLLCCSALIENSETSTWFAKLQSLNARTKPVFVSHNTRLLVRIPTKTDRIKKITLENQPVRH